MFSRFSEDGWEVFLFCYLADGVLHTYLSMAPGLEQSLSTLQQGFGLVLGRGGGFYSINIPTF